MDHLPKPAIPRKGFIGLTQGRRDTSTAGQGGSATRPNGCSTVIESGEPFDGSSDHGEARTRLSSAFALGSSHQDAAMGETATEPKPRIRWYQFSLASLFRLTTIIAILLGISRIIGVHVFFCAMAVLVILGCAFTPLLLLVLLCSLTNLSEKSILRIELGVLVILFALAIVLDVTAGLVGGVVVGTSLLLFLWGPQCLIIVCGFLATRTDNADCKLRRKVLPTELELDEHTDCSY